MSIYTRLLYFWEIMGEGACKMISNQKIQNSLSEIREITGCEAALYSAKGKLIASTGQFANQFEQTVIRFVELVGDSQVIDEYGMFKIFIENEPEYVLIMEKRDRQYQMIGKMAVCQIRNLLMSHAEQFDRNNFIQNVLLGNLLAVDMLSRAKKLHIDAKPRIVFVIDTGDKNNDLAIELVKNLSNMKSGDFVTAVDTKSIVLVKDVSHIDPKKYEEEFEGIADRLVDNLHMEAMIKVRVGYGNVVSQINELAQSFQEAKMALEVGRVFYAEKDTISYGRLGIGRLIYQLPMSLCQMFIREVFGDKVPPILDDEEAMSTINKFFENNLNISETARQLYVHRNTLVYRLERIERAIGLDIRSFDDAMTFRIAVMVLAHMRDAG